MANRKSRRGVATTELAVCLPILMIIIVGVNEVCSALYLKEQVTIAAYEGSRIGVQRGSTNDMVTGYIIGFLEERGINYNEDSVVQISTPSFQNAETMEHVTTTVQVPIAGNSLTGTFFNSQDVQASVAMRKEFKNN